jgi:hypothetical protein
MPNLEAKGGVLIYNDRHTKGIKIMPTSSAFDAVATAQFVIRTSVSNPNKNVITITVFALEGEIAVVSDFNYEPISDIVGFTEAAFRNFHAQAMFFDFVCRTQEEVDAEFIISYLKEVCNA